MFTPTNVVKGRLVLQGLLDTFCFKDAKDLVAQLPRLLGVEVPTTVTNVIVSNAEPSSSETTSLWIRLNNAGGFIGIYVFSEGQWRPIYPANTTVHTQVFWFTSEDGSVPEGYQKITGASTDVPPNVIPGIMAQYIQDPTNTFDQYFAASFIGF